MRWTVNTGAGNLSRGERIGSALLGVGLTWFFARRDSAMLRILGGAVGTSLIGRAFAGHCAMKASLNGESTLTEGLADQWRHTAATGRRVAQRVAESTRDFANRQRSDASESIGEAPLPRESVATNTAGATAPF
jgi:hypothetical protein